MGEGRRRSARSSPTVVTTLVARRPDRRGASPTDVAARVPRRRWVVRVLHMGLSALPRASRRTAVPATRGVEDVEEPSTLQGGSRVDAPPGTSVDFDGFYRAQYASVVRLAFSLCGSMQIAEELAQEAFVTAHQRWDRLHGFDRPDLWVRRVVINRSISFRRRETTERRLLERLQDRETTAAEPTLGDAELWAAMRQLSPRQAEALALFYVEDQPLSEVANILGLGEETVKTHLKRGRAALAERLADRARR